MKNVLLVIADQWRYQAFGCSGTSQVYTPNIDRFASESLRLTNAVSGCPVCSPFRASMMTGQYPLTHGVFMNDAPLNTDAVCLGEAFRNAGYQTAYIGKWHIDGNGRRARIPRERRRGFDFWRSLECTHRYQQSEYYRADEKEPSQWEGYDAFAQTREARGFITNRDRNRPFFMILSWGPPHDPYQTAPEEFRKLYDPESILLRPNIPPAVASEARDAIAGYYAHCTALDSAFGDLLEHLHEDGSEKDTIVVFLSDHGDLLGSHGYWLKQQPWEESVRIPFIIRHPETAPAEVNQVFIDAPDIMPTLLGLCDLDIPTTVEGSDWSATLLRGEEPPRDYSFLAAYHPFGNWSAIRGGREYRGIRTDRYTYVKDRNGPWLFFDNIDDPYQQNNLIGSMRRFSVRRDLEKRLKSILRERNDDFLAGMEYVSRWGYKVDSEGTIPTD